MVLRMTTQAPPPPLLISKAWERVHQCACGKAAYLIDGQVNAGIGDDAQQVGDVAPVESHQPFLLGDLPRAVKHPAVLAGLAQRQASLHHLQQQQSRGRLNSSV